MRPAIILFFLLIGLVTSCYKVYEPQVDATEKVLVVDGLMTNQADAYHVALTYAKPFNSGKKGTPVNSASIRKHQVCFLDDNFNFYALYYGLQVNLKDTTGTEIKTAAYQSYMIHNRILYLNQYTLNNETYLYYKSLNEQMQSEGKLFDPIAAQLTGNIKCISDPEINAIGFFEASSVNKSAYIVDFRNLTNSQPTLIKTPHVMPPEPIGCRINRASSIHHNIPSFWIFI